jgi:large subunit ribosomal protein L9
MAKTFNLLLTESVDALGIVGDVVKVRAGFARNYLLPRNLATQPTPERIAELAHKRAEAQKQVELLRKHRVELIEKLDGYELTLQRSCNDQGLLYGSVTQADISEALTAAGFAVRVRDVRMGQPIKRIDSYEVHIKPESDLEATIKLWVVSDRKLDLSRSAAEVDEEGNVVGAPAATTDTLIQEPEAKPAKHAKGEKADRAEATEKAEKPAKGAKAKKA